MGVFAWAKRSVDNAVQSLGGFQITDLLPQRNFPAVTRDVMAQVRRYADDMGGVLATTGSLNAYVVATGSGVTELRAGIKLLIRADRANTGEATINVDGLGPLPWVDAGGVRLTAGQIAAGRFYEIVLDPDVPAWRVQAGASTLTEIPGLIALQADVAARAVAAAASATATAADRQAVGTDRTATANSAAAAAASQAVAQAARSAAEAARDQLLDTILDVNNLTSLARQSAPKHLTTPRAFIDAKGGAIQTGPLSMRVPAGQSGSQSLFRAYVDMDAGDIARNAGRELLLLVELKTSIGFDTAFVGPGGAGDIRLSATPFGVPSGSVAALKVTDRADTYTLAAITSLTGSETQPAIDLFVAGDVLPLGAEATVSINKAMWVTLDASGSSEVVASGDAAVKSFAQAYTDALASTVATLPLSVPDMVALSTTRYVFDGGVKVDVCDRQMTIPVGRTGAGALMIPGLPFAGLAAGSRGLFRFRFQSSTDIGLSTEGLATKVYIYGATINRTDGSQIGAGGASISRVAPGIFDVTVPRTVDGTEREVEVYLGISDQSAARATQGFVVLRNAWTEIVSVSGSMTLSSQSQRCAEAKVALLASKPGFRQFLVVAADGSGDFTRVLDASRAISAGASATERNMIFVKPGRYTSECSETDYINPPDFVDIIGLGLSSDVQIIARFPDNQANQDAIQPFFLMRTCRIMNMTVILRNGRYPFHVEGGNSQARAVQEFINVIAIHEGSTVWPSPTAFGIGQHAGNIILFDNVEARSPTSCIGFHNNVAWTRAAYVRIRRSRLLPTGPSGQAISMVSTGAGIVSKVDVTNSTLNGVINHATIFNIPGAAVSAHKANRYEYDITVSGCTPVDCVSQCDVSCLALSSVAGASSAVALSGTAALVLFGNRPDSRAGAADRAAVVYSELAVEVLPGEVDPGVGLGVKLGNRTSSPLSLTVAFDGGAAVTISLDANYTAMSNADIVASFNTKLSTAMGGNTGGRAFSLAKPYNNRMPIHQPDREAIGLNADTASIAKGTDLAWIGRAFRVMTAADTLDLWAGVALNDAVPGERLRAQASGFIGIPHLLVTGSPSYAVGDLFGVGATPGRLTKGAAHASMRVRSIASYGPVFEILDARSDSAVLDASLSNVADFTSSDSYADYLSQTFTATGRTLFATGFVTFLHQNSSATQLLSKMRLVDLTTGTDVIVGTQRGTLALNGQQTNGSVGLIATNLTIGRSYSLRMQHYRVGSNGPTQILDQRIQGICV